MAGNCVWGKLPQGIQGGCSIVATAAGTAPENAAVLYAANNAVSGVNFAVDSTSAYATAETGGRAR